MDDIGVGVGVIGRRLVLLVAVAVHDGDGLLGGDTYDIRTRLQCKPLMRYPLVPEKIYFLQLDLHYK